MKLKRYQFISVVHLILTWENKVLLLRRFNTGYEDGNYSLPAGHIDQAETATQAVIRESKEEIKINLKRKDLTLVHVLHRNGDDHERIDFFFLAKSWQGELVIGEPNKCDQLRWCEDNNLPDNTIDYIKFVLGKINNHEIYSEFGWE